MVQAENCKVSEPFKVTLGELAWYDRCLFPGDFEDELVELKLLSPENAAQVRLAMIADGGRSRGIVELYQVFIGDVEIQRAFNEHLKHFLRKYREHNKQD